MSTDPFDNRANYRSGGLRSRLPLPEAQKMELRAMAERYGHCPFKVGDLIMPDPAGPIDAPEAGQPHLIVEVADPPHRNFGVSAPGETTTQGWGQMLDVRVLCYHPNGQICAWWAESWMFELYPDQAGDVPFDTPERHHMLAPAPKSEPDAYDMPPAERMSKLAGQLLGVDPISNVPDLDPAPDPEVDPETGRPAPGTITCGYCDKPMCRIDCPRYVQW